MGKQIGAAGVKEEKANRTKQKGFAHLTLSFPSNIGCQITQHYGPEQLKSRRRALWFRGTMVQKSLMLRYLINHFPASSRVSKLTNECSAAELANKASSAEQENG